jgi:hypothetical protein
MTLQPIGVLSLTGCFTFIDFDLDDAAGGAGAGGAAAVATSTGAGGGVGGNPPVGAGGTGGGEQPVAPPCEEWCDTCVGDACQPILYFDADQYITAVGVGGDQLVIMELGVVAPAEPADMKFLPANSDGQVASASNTISSAPGGYWNALQGWIAVDPVTGSAFYSPQGAATDHPVLDCSPSGDCQLAFEVQTAVNERSHLNSLTFFDGKVYGISPLTGRVFAAAPGAAAASIAFDLVVPRSDGGVGVPAGHDVAFGADKVVASSLGAPAPGHPCLGIGSEQLLIAGGELECPPLDGLYLNLSSLAVSDDGDVYYRVYLDGTPQLKGITLRRRDGNVETPFNDFELAVDSVNNGIGGVLVDRYHVYFFGESSGLYLLRCDVGGGNESCVKTSASLVLPGPMAQNDEYLFFASGSQLFRLAKPPLLK